MTIRRIASHGLCLVAGVAMAFAFASAGGKGKGPGGSSDGREGEGRSGGGAAGEAGARSNKTAGPPLKRGDRFREGWKLLGQRNEPIEVRLAHQREFLAAWAEVDLAAALEAAMAEAWDDEHGSGPKDPPPLLAAFKKAFAKDPEGSWQLIQSGRFGNGSQLLRKTWLATVAPGNPLLAVSQLGDMPPSLQKETIRIACGVSTGNWALLEQIRGKIAAMPPGKDTERQLAWAAMMLPKGRPDELLGQWVGAPAGNARSSALQGWAACLRIADTEQFEEALGQVPEESRGEATRAIFTQLQPGSEATLEVIGQLMAAGEWELLETQAPGKLYEFPAGKLELADWTLSLPDRAETGALVSSAMRATMRYEPEGIQEWIEALPADDWRRDLALMEYVRHARQIQNDAEMVEWGLSRMRNGDLKAEAKNLPPYESEEEEDHVW